MQRRTFLVIDRSGTPGCAGTISVTCRTSHLLEALRQGDDRKLPTPACTLPLVRGFMMPTSWIRKQSPHAGQAELGFNGHSTRRFSKADVKSTFDERSEPMPEQRLWRQRTSLKQRYDWRPCPQSGAEGSQSHVEVSWEATDGDGGGVHIRKWEVGGERNGEHKRRRLRRRKSYDRSVHPLQGYEHAWTGDIRIDESPLHEPYTSLRSEPRDPIRFRNDRIAEAVGKHSTATFGASAGMNKADFGVDVAEAIAVEGQNALLLGVMQIGHVAVGTVQFTALLLLQKGWRYRHSPAHTPPATGHSRPLFKPEPEKILLFSSQ
eukprot:3396402-Rhodomonas_salina.1